MGTFYLNQFQQIKICLFVSLILMMKLKLKIAIVSFKRQGHF